jgi:23S rRNA (guanosine2251-2'-O)-methyltransferase
LGGEQVEGRRAVAELLRARRRRAHDVWIEEGTKPAPILDLIRSLASAGGVPVRRVTRDRLAGQARTAAPQGVLARAAALPEADAEDLYRPDAGTGRPPFVVALDGVTDPQNLGALLRTADGAGATGVLLPRHRAAHVSPAAAKAAAGAIEWVPMATVAGIPSALLRAADAGLWIVGLHPDGDRSVYAVDPPSGGVVVVLGGESKGLSPLARRRCDALVNIPLRGALASLNVAAAGAIALFELSRGFVSDDSGEVFKADKPGTENS